MSLDTEIGGQKHRSALRDPQRRGRIVIGGLSLIIAAGYWWQASLMPQGEASQPGPGLWPSAVGAAWVIISVIVVLEAVTSVQVGGEVDVPRGRQGRDVILFYVATAVFAMTIPFLGMFLASILYTVSILRLTSTLPWWKVCVFGSLIGSLIPWVFISLLQLKLPMGVLGELF